MASRPGVAEAAALLRQRAERGLGFTPHFQPIVPAGASGTMDPAHAVDGSHAALVDNGAVWVVATRAEAVSWPGPADPPPVATVHATFAADAATGLAAAYEAHGLPAPRRVGSVDAYATAWRELEEHQALLRALDDMPAGALLLVDGALLHLGDERAQAMADQVLQKAARRGVQLVGVAKRSGLRSGDVPLLPSLLRAGAAAYPGTAWVCPVPEKEGVFVARLHSSSPHAFRLDAPDPTAIPRLLPYCRDAVYTGYPYPLALVHNRVAITAAEAAGLREQVADAVRVEGGVEAWALLQDFHDILDRNVP